MMFKDYICALDIGSSKIAVAVAELKHKRIATLFLDNLSIKGIEKGIVTDAIKLTASIEGLLKIIREKSGINIKSAYVTVSGQNIIAKHSRAIMPLADRGNKLITSFDLQKINEEARILGSSLEEEIIHSIPFSYGIDSKSDIANPVGLYSHKLELDLYLVCLKLSSIENVTRIVNQAGYEVRDLFLSGIATSKAVLNADLKEGNAILCDIGSDITEILFFRDGLLRHIEIIAIGSTDLTKQIAEELNLSLELAEEVKKSCLGIGESSPIKEDKEILIKKNNAYKPIKQKLISEILTKKTKSICSLIKENVQGNIPLNKIDNFITTGRAVLLDGFLEMLEADLGVSIKLGRLINPRLSSFINKESNLSGLNYLNYATALGMICHVLDERQKKSLSATPAKNPFLRLINKCKEVYQEYF